jgi:hypothetical protein
MLKAILKKISSKINDKLKEMFQIQTFIYRLRIGLTRKARSVHKEVYTVFDVYCQVVLQIRIRIKVISWIWIWIKLISWIRIRNHIILQLGQTNVGTEYMSLLELLF